MIKKIWSEVDPEWRHLPQIMSEEKKERIIRRVRSSLIVPVIAGKFSEEGNQSVLDWGCGGGLIAEELTKMGFNVSVVDLIEDSLLKCTGRCADIQHAQIIPEDPDLINYSGPEVDWILCNEVIQHFPSVEYFEKIVNIWANKISPEYISIQFKSGRKNIEAENYDTDFLNGLILDPTYVRSLFSSFNYSVISRSEHKTKYGREMEYLVFKKN